MLQPTRIWPMGHLLQITRRPQLYGLEYFSFVYVLAIHLVFAAVPAWLSSHLPLVLSLECFSCCFVSLSSSITGRWWKKPSRWIAIGIAFSETEILSAR